MKSSVSGNIKKQWLESRMTQSRFIVFLLFVMLSLQGCDTRKEVDKGTVNTQTPHISLDEVAAANTIRTLVQTYDTVVYAQLDYIGAQTIHITMFKNESGEITWVEDDNGLVAYRTDAMTFIREKGITKYRVIGDQFNLSDNVLFISDRNVTAQSVDHQGNVVLKTTADIDQEYADALRDWSVTTDDKMVSQTTLAADDKRILAMDFVVLRPDGAEINIATAVMRYNLPLQYPDVVQDYLDSTKVAIQVVLADGSVRTAWIPKQERFSWSCDEGYVLYTDETGSTMISELSDPVDQDMTLYVLKKK